MSLWIKAGRGCCEENCLRLGLATGTRLASPWIPRTRFFSIALEEEQSSLDKPTKLRPKIGIYELLDQLRVCCIAKDLTRGRSVHARANETGEASNLYVANCLISMFAKCGSLVDAKNVFDGMTYRDVVTWNSLLTGYAEQNEGELVLELFASMAMAGCSPNARTFVAALKACSNIAVREEGKKINGQFLKERALEKGQEIHAQALASGCPSDIFLASTVVDMYASCGSLDDAYANFSRMPRHNVVSWSALMMGCAENGQPELALELFLTMKQTNRAPNSRAFVAALKACAKVAVKEEATQAADGRVIKKRSLRKGVAIHSQAAKLGLDSNLFVASALLLMYVKCGSTSNARRVFDKMPRHDLVSWTSMLLAYAENGEEELALEFFTEIPLDGCEPDAVACVAAIKACTNLAAREEGKLVDGRSMKAVALERGCALHSRVVSCRCETDMAVAITLVDMYSRCGSVEDARRVFDRMVYREVALWNSLMLCYVDNGEAQLALEAFVFLRPENSAPNPLTFVAAIKACTSLAAAEKASPVMELGEMMMVKSESLERGMIVHSKAVGYGCDRQLLVASAVMDMYGRCGSLLDARIAFDKSGSWNTVLWNGLMFCYVENGEAEMALELLSAMHSNGLEPDALSYVSACKACASLASKAKATANSATVARSLERGRELHCEAANFGFFSEIFLANSVVDMYAKCGSMREARRAFDAMAFYNVVSWTTLILGYSDNQEESSAEELFQRMRKECGEYCEPDALSYVAVLKACGTSAAVETVKLLHAEISRNDRLQNSLVASLVDAYGKCGSVTNSQLLFDSVVARDLDLVTWTALLSAHSRGGDAHRVLELFQAMQDDGIAPNGVTFISILAACSHAGLVEQGKHYFEEMSSKYGIVPEVEHYVCMVDMLGRANKVELAMEMVSRMKVEPNDVVWRTVLGACKRWKNLGVGKAAYESLLGIKEDSAAYVLMESIYKQEREDQTQDLEHEGRRPTLLDS
ncbi:pentatricopeptide repeat-containing protein At2g33680-like isoform X1 [Selaginella moellendorffii]|uniref:pentatricopeptide repeat-containing protein At2g33680-like isoform X1 n=1 Tax=Selaginella moellendorffii TaxID=88036 RepID=UPI000D1CA8FA|nr:pentatricopeptide repeat-containing protein At2g33680-like isoform X1 [Selaginella moellendorffii]|eukprot:XP_024536785.1 pentatricopeptide repeat-containing protein At2g33680-like isoform X1 [Selaginella moellendorffii]